MKNVMEMKQRLQKKIVEARALNLEDMDAKQTADFNSKMLEVNDLQSEIDKEEVSQREAMQNGIPAENYTGMEYSSRYAHTADGRSIRMIPSTEKLAKFASSDGANWNLADFVRVNMGIEKRADSLIGSPATVGLLISSEIIDDVRAKSRLIQAGSVTIPIEGDTNIARIDGDPTVYEHTAGQTDISESKPTLTPILLRPQSLVCLIPIGFELAQDSKNLDAALRTSISGAMALKLDQLGIATILNDSNIPDSNTAESCATWAGVLAAVTSALGVNQDIPKALICNTTDFGARAALLASTAGSWLGAPPILSNMLDLPTSSMSTGFATFGNFEAGVGVAMRQDLQLEILRFGKPTSASHYLIATLRAQIVVLQPKVLYNQVTSGASTSSSPSSSPSASGE